jgi:phosphoribosylaminoimidazolecarboxamide formyltransferase/IMP cyclohydrolase
LVQDRDIQAASPATWTHSAGPKPTPDQLAAGAFLETACRFVSSNAIVLGGPTLRGGSSPYVLHGAGGGQVDRVTACKIAVSKAGPKAKGAIAAGDAFFPFSDGPQILIDAGISMIIHPGGSKRDQDTFDLCNARGVTCMTTGVRHFKH